MRARLKDPYTGPAGRFEAGRVVTDQQIPRDQLQAMIDAGCADAVGVRPVEQAVRKPPETADIKHEPEAAPKHVGGGWYEMPDGERVRGKEAAGLE